MSSMGMRQRTHVELPLVGGRREVAGAERAAAAERAKRSPTPARPDELTPAVDARTLEILERRRRSGRDRGRGWLVRRALMVSDLAGLSIAFLLAQIVFGGTGGMIADPGLQIFVFCLSLPGWVAVAKLYGLYEHDEERTDHSTLDDVVPVFHLVTVGVWVFYAAGELFGLARVEIGKLVLFWLLAIGLVVCSRAVARSVSRRSIYYLQNTVIVGAGEVGQLVARKFLRHPEYGINVVGFVDEAPKERREDIGHLTLLGSTERLPAIVRLLDIERVVIAFSNESHNDTLDLVRSLKDLDVQVDIVPRLFEIVGPNVGMHTVGGLPLVGLPPLRLSRSSGLMKRAMDVALSATGLLVLAPLLAILALAVKLTSPGSVFFRQVRMGAGEQTFRIYKFRTMSADADERKAEVAHLNKHALDGGDPRMFKIPDDPRVTRVGRMLRQYSLDELPQLINVLKGEMSLVGPRPLILAEDEYVNTAWARKRLNLKPGMTGLWQVLGRHDIPFEEMIKLDYLYVTNWSLWGDLKLLLQTVPVAFRSSSVVH